MFAHRMRWFLKSFCVGGYSFASTERKHRVSMLIEEVEQRGIQPAQTFAQQDNEHTPLVHSSKFQYDGAQLKNTPYSEEKCLYRFMDNVHFMEQLGKLSSRLITAPHKDRNEKVCNLNIIFLNAWISFENSLERYNPSTCRVRIYLSPLEMRNIESKAFVQMNRLYFRQRYVILCYYFISD